MNSTRATSSQEASPQDAYGQDPEGPGTVARIKDWLRDPVHGVQRRWQARRHAGDLTPVQDHTGNIQPGQVLLFACLRNEAFRLPSFLAHYRSLGVQHFLFVDNDSSDGFNQLIKGDPSISCWHTSASYREANYGMHWLNALLHRHGVGHWCVTCDLDEWLIYPHYTTRSLAALGRFLESEGRESLACLMLDMYGPEAPAKTHFGAGDTPLAVTPWFDARGYTQRRGLLKEALTQGGPRRRLLFRDAPESAPVLNKTPFVRWQSDFSYFLSMHQLVPSRLNEPHGKAHNSPTGCLLHFKYFNTLIDKAKEELERKEHFNNAAEYRRYADEWDGLATSLRCSMSRKLEDWTELVELGLMNRGRWF